MKALNVYFEDLQFKEMSKFKGKLSWRDFLILMYNHCKEAEKRGDLEVQR